MRSFARRWTVAAGLALLAVLLSAGVAAALTADAGGNQTVNEGDLVTLDGRGSTQSEGRPILSYAWAQVDDDGPTVELTGANMPVATFTAPEVDAEGAVLEFELTVTDDLGDSDTDSVTITVT
ncbi:MAG: PKD domain-containing protein, partial [Deferrisomatales bacterium]